MNQSQSRFRHIIQLKKLSQQLRNSTQLNSEINFNIVKQILTATQSISRNNSQQSFISLKEKQKIKSSRFTNQQQSKYKQSQFQSPKQSRLTQKQNYQNQKKLFLPVFQLFTKAQRIQNEQKQKLKLKQKLKQSVINQDDKNSRIRLLQPSKQTNQQNTQLKIALQYNQQLQSKLQELQNQLSSTRQQLQQLKNNQSVPFFRLNQKIQAFITKIPVFQEDYDKLEFTTYQADLNLQNLTLSNYANKIEKQFNFNNLINVVYPNQSLIILRFQKQTENQQKSIIQTIYIHFKDQQQYRKWDLAFYMNKKIGLCLEKQNKLFQSQPQLIKKHQYSQMSPLMKKSSFNQISPKRDQSLQNLSNMSANDESFKTVQDKELLKAYIQAKQKQLQLRKMLNNHLLNKIHQKKSKNNISNNKNFSPQKNEDYTSILSNLSDSNQKKEQQIQYKQKNPNQYKPRQKLVGIQSIKQNNNKQKNQYLLKKNEEKSEMLPRLNTVKQQNAQDQRSANDQALQSYIKNMNIKKQEIQSFRQQPSNQKKLFRDQKANSNALKIQQAVFKLGIDLQMRRQKANNLQKAYTHLKSGYQFTKYAAGGWQPHKKKVYLTNNGSQLQFVDVKNKNDVKTYKITDLVAIQYPKIGKGIQKHLPNAKFDMGRFAILTFKDKLVQIGSQIPQNINQFIGQLHLVRNQIQPNK